MKRVLWVGGVILAIFLTLTLTLPTIQPIAAPTPGVIRPAMTVALLDKAGMLQAATPIPPANDPTRTATALPTVSTALPEVIPSATGSPDAENPVVATPLPETQLVNTVTLQDLGEDDLALNGLYSAGSLWIPLPSNWIIEYIQVDLNYSASPLLHPERANMTVLANEQQIVSFRLAGQTASASFVIPKENIDQGNGVSLAFAGYLRLTDLVCEETDNPGQWVTILNTTRLTIGANLDRSSVDLAAMGRLLLAHNSISASPPLLFVLPDNPDAVTLTTAAQVAARLGEQSGFAPIAVALAGSLTETQRAEANLVVIGLPEDQPVLEQLAAYLPAPLIDGGFYTTTGAPIPPEHGVAQILRSPWNDGNSILLVSAGNAEGLSLAGQAFADRVTFAALTGTYQFIASVPARNDTLVATPLLTEQATFADLGYGDRATGGAGTSSETYYFRWPPGWTLGDGSQLTLNLISSPAIETGSHVTVFINDVFVGAEEATPDSGSPLTFTLSPTLINPTLQGDRIKTLKLLVRIVNVVSTDECRQGEIELAWMRIQSDSFFTLVHVYADLPNLQLFPYPFVSDRLDRSVVLVLPDAPTLQELRIALSIAVRLGDYALGDIQLNLLPASQLSEAAQRDAYLLILGERARQPWVDEFLAAFPPITPDGVYQVQNETTGALLEELSPWNAERVLLVVYGESALGLEQAATALLTLPPVEEATSALLLEADAPPETTESPTAEITAEPESPEATATVAAP